MKWQHRLAIMAFSIVCVHALAAAPVLMATMNNRASFSVGGSLFTVAVGETSHGIRLISVNGTSVEIETDGKRSSLAMGQAAFAPAPVGKDMQVASLTVAQDHQFHTWLSTPLGRVRGTVMPGLPYLTLSAKDAKLLGIRVDKTPPPGVMDQPKGRESGAVVTVDELKVEGVPLYGVDVVVNWRDDPAEAEIGSSVLKNFVIEGNGSTLTLTKRK
ncbi:MAG: hypothetical protein JO142_01515 [Burkholderiales bacterium]|nr:hypothetical protein [Burkholderiales bacterium]